jgi:hypothetical protein
MIRFLPLSLLALALAACNAGQPDQAPAAVPPASTGQPAADVAPAPPPATASPAPTAPPAGSGLAGYAGYGDLRFGMSEAEARQAWGGDLNGDAPADGCHYLNPVSAHAPSYFALMFEGGRFVRYDVGNDNEVAPGGGKVGMDAGQIRALYGDRVAESPHKYVAGASYLRVPAPDGDGVLVFETDAAGRVTAWHAGVAPQVDYIEGCS